ncbi:hypothetical protein BB560_002546 [Smittium megazygosporum]|uniref:Uncharacterized protein n=1 Tax=Smittium megazygosporum TaxID=133381 RepID=A0A2T9Z1A7_9FUNG|nr:hypothetical protein BB560_005684 [Smittium megazygosporum]PVV02988.1 hypothetical protein BB560_002546 [Smittium megazygosporum]
MYGCSTLNIEISRKEFISDELKPITALEEAVVRPSSKITLENNFLELLSFELMEFIEDEGKKLFPLRNLMNSLLNMIDEGYGPNLISERPSDKDAILEIISKLNEILMNQEDLIYRYRETRDKIVTTQNKKLELRDKVAKSMKRAKRKGNVQ